jgi:N-acetylglucosamine-6-sulfatase
VTPGATGLRRTRGVVISVVALAAAAAAPLRLPVRDADPRPNVIVILTDDQSYSTLPAHPAAMPYLQSRIADPMGHWRWFPNAFIETPLCCPSRSTILTGRYSRHTGVENNLEGQNLDESQTLAVWLHDAGYHTGLVGKYLNRYPFDRGPYVPAGWDRWVGKGNLSGATTYYGYPFVDQGVPQQAGNAPASYATDFLAGQATDFIRSAPADRPYFLLFTPSAPHEPWTPAPRDVGTFAGLTLPRPASFGAVEPGDPPWVQALPPIDDVTASALDDDRVRERETLLAVDDAVRSIVDAVAARGDLDRTVIFFLTDNGFSYGEHRLIGKACPYDECIRTPFAVYVPGGQAGSDPALVSNADLAPTIAALAGTRPGFGVDGANLAPLLTGQGRPPPRDGVFIEYHGDALIPAWTGVRTADFAYIRTGDAEQLYDLSGAVGPADPLELDNRAADPRYAGVRARLAALLTGLASHAPGAG